jgi:2,5-diamino-6-(ribosylamino)-4(3H)-pyrimidinone 5'-phosphate reductase
MKRPRVVLHSLLSLDGKLDGFAVNAGLYYELSARIPHEAVLSGSGTIVAAARQAGVDLRAPDAGETRASANPERPILAVVDSGGRLTRFDWLHAGGHWREVLIFCSRATPAQHLEHLRCRGIPHHVVGEDRVDLSAALDVLGDRHLVTTARIDAGAGLNGALLRAGLVDEISAVVAPFLAGERGGHAMSIAEGVGQATGLELRSAEPVRSGHLWLRYRVRHRWRPAEKRSEPPAPTSPSSADAPVPETCDGTSPPCADGPRAAPDPRVPGLG